MQVVFGLSSSSSGRPDLGLTMQADYYGNQAIVKGFSLVDGRVRNIVGGILSVCKCVFRVVLRFRFRFFCDFSPFFGCLFLFVLYFLAFRVVLHYASQNQPL